jgi:hypothetical protein
VPEEKFIEYRDKLAAKGVRVSPILDHDDSPFGVGRCLKPPPTAACGELPRSAAARVLTGARRALPLQRRAARPL